MAPPPLSFIQRCSKWVSDTIYNYGYLQVEQGENGCRNPLYCSVGEYLSTLPGCSKLMFLINPNQTVNDSFKGINLLWEHHRHGCYILKFNKKHSDLVHEYMLRISHRTVEVSGLQHPLRNSVSLGDVALDPSVKRELVETLVELRTAEQFRCRTGYPSVKTLVIYGLRGSGKNTLATAVANFLGYSITYCNHCLPGLISPRTVVIVRDEDLLNLEIKALNEVVFILIKDSRRRVNYDDIEGLAVDMQICMSYCSFKGFKTLAKSYLEIEEHTLFKDIEDLINHVDILPSRVCKVLFDGRRDVDKALETLLDCMKSPISRKRKNAEVDDDVEIIPPRHRTRSESPYAAA